MTRWKAGEATIERLLKEGHLDRVPANEGAEAGLLASARRHLASAASVLGGDLDGAYSLAYDASRKAATALLAHQGLRPTTAGGHLAVTIGMRAQFGGVPGMEELDMLRRRRHQTEYPDPSNVDALTEDEVQEAIELATAAVDSVAKLLEDPATVGIF